MPHPSVSEVLAPPFTDLPQAPTRLDPAAGGATAGARRGKVLVVDDHSGNAQMLRRALELLGYEVEASGTGRGALEVIGERMPDVVLLDVMMPDLSGLEVLQRLRSAAETVDLPVVMVSGLGETRDIVEGLALGANDYVTKPINMPVLQARLATQVALKRARDELKRSAQLLAAELDRHARELQVAGHVQRSILPKPSGRSATLKSAWCYEPATEVGGDLLDVIPLSGGRTLLFIADAMGHGVQAALVVTTVKAALAAHLAEAEDLSHLMERLDEAVGSLFEDRYVTAAACVIDPAAMSLRYAVAGHPPILLAGPSGVVELLTGGLPLGTAIGWAFHEEEVALEPGSAVLLYSDGVTEVLDGRGQLLGVGGLAERFGPLWDAEPEDIAKSLRGAVDDFRGAVPLSDDLTLLAARIP